MIKNKIFKQGIGIAEKAKNQEEIAVGGDVNHNGVKIGICGLHHHPSDPFLFLGFFSDPIPCLKILFFNHSSLCAFFLIHSWVSLRSQMAT